MNIGNLFNKDWGHIEDYGFNATARVANYAGICNPDCAMPGRFGGQVRVPLHQRHRADHPREQHDKGNTAVSRWSVMLGLKYKF